MTAYGISRRKMLAALAMASGVAVAGCDDEGSREVSFPNAIKDQVDEVKKTVDALESDVEEFENRRWREVVPEVQNSLGDLRTGVEDLEQMLEPPETD